MRKVSRTKSFSWAAIFLLKSLSSFLLKSAFLLYPPVTRLVGLKSKTPWGQFRNRIVSNYNLPWPLKPHQTPGPKNHLPSVPRLVFWQLSHHCDFATHFIWNVIEDNSKKFPTSPCRWDTTCSQARRRDWGMLQSSQWIPLCSGLPVQPASAWAVHSSAQPPGPSPHWCRDTLDGIYVNRMPNKSLGFLWQTRLDRGGGGEILYSCNFMIKIWPLLLTVQLCFESFCIFLPKIIPTLCCRW